MNGNTTPSPPPITSPAFWRAYRHHLTQWLTEIKTIDKFLIPLAIVGFSVWLPQTVHTTGSLWFAALLGAWVTALGCGVVMIALALAVRVADAHPWYGVDRTVHHVTLGACQVRAYSDWEGLETVWVLICPREVDAPARWAPLDELEQHHGLAA
ncbi:hypothetical protein [Nocardiopsis alba]|uniref:hypothetical protein n=2 Tax=Nocardiopsis alba TaxID=53437 RepID=UPI00367151A0